MSPITKLAAKVMENERNRRKKREDPDKRKLSAIETRQISESNLPATALAAAFGVTVTRINMIRPRSRDPEKIAAKDLTDGV